VFVSYDEKPGIQAIANTAPDLPSVSGKHASIARDHEYKRLGTLSLLAGIDLLTGYWLRFSLTPRIRARGAEMTDFFGYRLNVPEDVLSQHRHGRL
jgi:hypothetical protein